MYNDTCSLTPHKRQRRNGIIQQSLAHRDRSQPFTTIIELIHTENCGLEGNSCHKLTNSTLTTKKDGVWINYWPVLPKSRSTAAWTFPAVAISARIFSCVSKKPISWSCDNWVAYSSSGGTGYAECNECKADKT